MDLTAVDGKALYCIELLVTCTAPAQVMANCGGYITPEQLLRAEVWQRMQGHDKAYRKHALPNLLVMSSFLMLYESSLVGEDSITVVTEGDGFLLSLFLFPDHGVLPRVRHFQLAHRLTS